MIHRIERDDLMCFRSEDNYRHMEEMLKKAELQRKMDRKSRGNPAIGFLIGVSVSTLLWFLIIYGGLQMYHWIVK